MQVVSYILVTWHTGTVLGTSAPTPHNRWEVDNFCCWNCCNVLQFPSEKRLELSVACHGRQCYPACQLFALCVYWLTKVVVRSAVLGTNYPPCLCLSRTLCPLQSCIGVNRTAWGMQKHHRSGKNEFRWQEYLSFLWGFALLSNTKLCWSNERVHWKSPLVGRFPVAACYSE